jgi:hypothetical protein
MVRSRSRRCVPPINARRARDDDRSPATNIHMGTDDAVLVLSDLRPGDELVIVVSEVSPAAVRPRCGGARCGEHGRGRSDAGLSDGSQRALGPISSAPIECSELMVFRNHAP